MHCCRFETSDLAFALTRCNEVQGEGDRYQTSAHHTERILREISYLYARWATCLCPVRSKEFAFGLLAPMPCHEQAGSSVTIAD